MPLCSYFAEKAGRENGKTNTLESSNEKNSLRADSDLGRRRVREAAGREVGVRRKGGGGLSENLLSCLASSRLTLSSLSY